jgi:hypothetical protein
MERKSHISKNLDFLKKSTRKKSTRESCLDRSSKHRYESYTIHFLRLHLVGIIFQNLSSHSHLPRLPFLFILSNTRPYRIGTGGPTAAGLPIENNLSSPQITVQTLSRGRQAVA